VCVSLLRTGELGAVCGTLFFIDIDIDIQRPFLPLPLVESTEGISEIWFREPFPRWGFLRFRVRVRFLLMVQSSPGVNPKSRFDPILDAIVQVSSELFAARCHRLFDRRRCGLHTILLLPILHGVWHTQGRSRGGGLILPNSRALVMQQCGRCRWAGGMKE